MKNPTLPAILASALMFNTTSATIVTTSADEDNGSLGGGNGVSLREAVKYSASGSTITFAAALSGKTIRLTGGYLLIQTALTIDASALPGGITLSGDKTGNGKTADDTKVIVIYSGTLVLNSLTITGGGNTVGGSGIYAGGEGSPLNLSLTNCTLSGNSAGSGGGIYFSGSASVLTIRNSTFSGNSATTYSGGAIDLNSGTTVNIQNSTFAGNSAQIGGAIRNYNGSLTLENTTVSANTATSSGGAIHSSGTLILRDSILAGNTAPNSPNILGASTGSYNLTSGTPRLAPLGDYGGRTQTMPPVPGSPAIGAASWPPAFTTDQRGFPRVDKPEIGAAEFQSSDHARFWNLDFDGDGNSYGIEQALGTNNFTADPANSRNLSVPTFDASGHAVLRFGKTVATTGTRWILKRSPDLSSGSFQEIYRCTGSSDIAAPGISYIRTSSIITVTDSNPFPGGGFYRFEAVLEP